MCVYVRSCSSLASQIGSSFKVRSQPLGWARLLLLVTQEGSTSWDSSDQIGHKGPWPTCQGYCKFRSHLSAREKNKSGLFWPFLIWLEQRQYKNDSTEFRCMLILNLPPCFLHRIAEWKSAPNSKQTFIWSPSIRSYIILALVWILFHSLIDQSWRLVFWGF